MKITISLNFIDGNHGTCRALLAGDIKPVLLLFDQPMLSIVVAIQNTT